MLTARNVITVLIVLAVVSILGAVWTALQPLDQGGLGADSYGTRAQGTKAVMDILVELGVPIDRALVPFGDWVDHAATYVVWSPDTELLSVEPAYLQRLADWVRAGGRVVVAPERGEKQGRWPARTFSGQMLVQPTTVLKELGLREIQTRLADEADADRQDSAEPAAEGNPEDSPDDDSLSEFEKAIRKHLGLRPRATHRMSVRTEGDLQPLGALVAQLEVPQPLQVLDLNGSKPSGQITAVVDGREEVLVAGFSLGAGQVIVVSDPAFFENRLIARADNPVLAAHLLAAANRPVIWDEFYHGLTVRGNAWFLLTRGRYAILALMVLATMGVWIWRQVMFLGPPLAPNAVARRSIAEYVEAMARLFQRSRASNLFVLRVVSDGVLWWQRRKLKLRPGQETLEAVTAALARRNPAAARELLDAVTAANIILSRGSRVSNEEALRALRKLADCI